MKNLKYGLISLVTLLTSFMAYANNYRIMFIGDSITEGFAGAPTYRCYLLNMLPGLGHSFDSVGSQNTQVGGAATGCPYVVDADHEGHAGWRTDQILASITLWASQYSPDIALIHLGTNDIAAKQNDYETASEVAYTVQILQKVNPNMGVFIAGIIPINDATMNNKAKTLNSYLQSYAASLNTATSKVYFVDLHTDFDMYKYLADGVHPNAAGGAEMANRWYTSINKYFNEKTPTSNTTSVTITPTSSIEFSNSECKSWDFSSNQACPAGYFNCDCSGACGSTSCN